MEKLILKYLSDSITQEELATLEEWLLASDKNKEQFKAFVQLHENTDFLHRKVDTAAAFKKISQTTNKTKNYKSPFNHVYRYAAILIFVFGAAVILNQFFNTNDLKSVQAYSSLYLSDGSVHELKIGTTSTIKTRDGHIIADFENDMLTYSNADFNLITNTTSEIIVPNGNQLKVKLVDGSLIHINSGSKIKHALNFQASENRDVFLEGEAYFEVFKNKNAPFIVQTNDFNVRVLGTKFNVSSYSNEHNASVVLTEGKVELIKTDQRVVMKPGELAVIENNSIKKENANIEKHIAWTNNELYFENDQFKDIVKELERHFVIEIENQYSDLDTIQFTGKFKSTSISEILEVFKELEQFEFEKTNNKIRIFTTKN